MIEDQNESFPLPNDRECIWRFIKSELEEAGFEVQRMSEDETITTDREVPESIKSRLREYAADKGITLKFRVSRQET